MALVGVTDKIVYLDDGDIVSMTKDTCEIFARTGSDTWQPVERKAVIVQAYAGAAELGPYRHYMQKEIFEQPRAIAATLEGVEGITPTLFGPEAETVFRDTRRILMLACGTSFYAALTSKYWLEAIAGIPDVEIASEYRYRTTIPDPGTLVVTISQSGETADTLAALKHAVAMGMTKTLAICNVAQSALVHECRLAYITRAGVEIGVASTKAFTTQLVALYLLTLVFAKLSGRLDAEKEAQALSSLRHIPADMAGRSSPRSLRGPNALPVRKMRFSWGAACIIRLRSKARLSSRKSATSTPRRIRPANSSTARWHSLTPTCRW